MNALIGKLMDIRDKGLTTILPVELLARRIWTGFAPIVLRNNFVIDLLIYLRDSPEKGRFFRSTRLMANLSLQFLEYSFDTQVKTIFEARKIVAATLPASPATSALNELDELAALVRLYTALPEKLRRFRRLADENASNEIAVKKKMPLIFCLERFHKNEMSANYRDFTCPDFVDRQTRELIVKNYYATVVQLDAKTSEDINGAKLSAKESDEMEKRAVSVTSLQPSKPKVAQY